MTSDHTRFKPPAFFTTGQQPQADNAKFKNGEKVRLVPVLHNGDVVSRSEYLFSPNNYNESDMERVTILSSEQCEWGISYTGLLHPADLNPKEPEDDGLRTFSEDQILWVVNDAGERLGLMPSS